MAWPKGTKRSPETIAKIQATRAANRAAKNNGTAPSKPARTARATPMTSAPLDNGTPIRIDERAPGPAHIVAGANGVVEDFKDGAYRIRCGPKLTVRVPAEYVHVA
jgi:hypothetical protein